MKKISPLFTLSLVISLLTGCVANKDDDDSSSDGSTKLDFEINATADDNGIAATSFKTAKNVTKFTVSAENSAGKAIRITKLTVDGNDYLTPKGETLSLANEFSANVVTATVPSRSIDPELFSPQQVSISAQLESANKDQVTFKVTSRTDSNLSSGALNLNIFYVGSVGAEASTKSAVQSALDVSKDIFSNVGITTKIKEIDIGGPVALPVPGDGSTLYSTNAASEAFPSVNVFIGGDIANVGGSGDLLGISANIPGPPTPTLDSAVAISIFSSAGSDGVFDAEDVRILGETIAHESGHYMGLFHPIDFSGSSVASSDPLTDTAGCTFITDCVSKDDLTSNLMFPSPVEDGKGGYKPQNKLTDQQRGVLNRYAAVD